MSTFLVRIFGKFIPHSIVIVERPARLAERAARAVQIPATATIRARKTIPQAEGMQTCGCSRPFLAMPDWLPLPTPPTC
jgi:hypothetical protein